MIRELTPGITRGFRAGMVMSKVLLAGVAVVAATGLAQRAEAQGYFSRPYYGAPAVSRHYDAPREPRARAPRNTKAKVATPSKGKRDVPIRHPFGETMPKGPLQLVISIADQHAHALQ